MKYVVTINGKKYDVEVEKVNAYRPLTVEEVQSGNIQRTAPVAAPAPAPTPAPAPAAAPAPAPAPAPAAASGGANTVVSPMPGNILDVRTAVGSSVKAGQVLIILEAMKMENEIVAPSDGVVESIAVKQGDVVETDQTLVVLK